MTLHRKTRIKLENTILTIGLVFILIPVAFSFYANYNQARAVDKWKRIIPPRVAKEGAAQVKNNGPVLESIDFRKLVEAAPSQGESVALIKIPAINATYDVIEGATWANLAKGPIRLSSSSLIGADGTTVISGHRTMYGAPFHNLDKVALNDIVELYTKKAAFAYRVIGIKSVKPTNMCDVIADGGPRLILSTCDPVFSARNRLLIISELASAQPLK